MTMSILLINDMRVFRGVLVVLLKENDIQWWSNVSIDNSIMWYQYCVYWNDVNDDENSSSMSIIN